jgi:RHS repeat-associated protein
VDGRSNNHRRRRRRTAPFGCLDCSRDAYDANGLRTQRVDATGIVNYLLDGPTVLEELDGVLATQTRYVNNPQAVDDIVSFTKGGATYWPLTDAIGSIYATTDFTGAIAHRYDFDVYGVRTDSGGAGPGIDRGYTSRYLDANGLQENRDRQRRPELGAWLQADRAETVDGANVYRYTRNLPTLLTDPTGRYSISVEGADSYELLRAELATWELQWAAFDTDDGDNNFGFTVSSAFGTRQKSLSSYLKYMADPITFDFAECASTPPPSTSAAIGGLNDWFDFPNGNNYQLIKMYPEKFAQHPKANRPDFVAAIMFYAWALASILRDPAGQLDLPPLWSAKTDHYSSSDPPDVVAKELAVQEFPQTLWP